jgi:SAM-dependent methyltransferase
MPSAVSLQPLATLAKPVKALVRPFPRLNAALWNVQYRLGIWDYLDATTDGLEPLLLAKRYTPHPAILDLGCGTSTNLRLAPGMYRRYHGVDISGKAIARARALARPDCTFEVADILRYETSERYDAILLREVLYYLPVQALRDFLQRLAGWLNPGGKIIIQMWSPGTHTDVYAAIRDCGLPFQEETARKSGGADEKAFLVLSGPR